MVWLQGFGKESNSIKISFAQHISGNITYSDLSKNRWSADSIVFSCNHNIEEMIQKYLEQYNEKLKISTKFSNITKSALIELQNRRLKTVKLKDGIKGYAAQ